MSLDALFRDRKSRKYITDSVNNASDVGKGTCEACGKESFLLGAFNKKLCEKCCESVLGIARDYDVVLESVSDESLFEMVDLKEGYIIPDMTKLQNDANANFGGSIFDLLKSYNLTLYKDWNERLHKGRIWIQPKDIEGGKSRLNQFIIDYSCEFTTDKIALRLVPDADGTFAPLIVKGKTIQPGTPIQTPTSPKTPSVGSNSKVQKQSSTSSVSAVGTGTVAQGSATKQSTVKLGKGYVKGTNKSYVIQVGETAELSCSCVENNGSYACSINNIAGKEAYAIPLTKEEYEDMEKSAEKVRALISDNPGILFPAFDNGAKEVEISKYSIYKFAVDEYSFGDKFSMVPVYNGKKYSNTRIFLSDKALNSRISLNAELTAYMDNKIQKDYPMLAKGKNSLKTSVGTAVFELDSIEKDNGIVVLNADLANKKFKARIDGKRLSTEKEARDAYAEVIHNALVQGFIPGFKDSSITNSKSTDSYAFDIKNIEKDRDIDVFATFDWNDLYDTGNISFNMSIIDSRTGIEQPKELRKFIYRKTGVSLPDFLNRCAIELYNEFFRGSNMPGSMTDSTIAKMKSPSKKAALLRRISDDLHKKMKKEYRVSDIENCDVSVDFDVNVHGKVVNAYVTISDPFEDLTDDSRKLKDLLSVEKRIPWLKFIKADSSMKDGPAVVYKVIDFEEFHNSINLSLYESAILEVFGVKLISESKSVRKTISV